MSMQVPFLLTKKDRGKEAKNNVPRATQKKEKEKKIYEMIFIQIERINLTSMIDANPLFSTRSSNFRICMQHQLLARLQFSLLKWILTNST